MDQSNARTSTSMSFKGLFPSSCACACTVMSYIWTGTMQAQAQEKWKYFLSADKKTNGSSPTLTDTQDGNRIWRETLCLCKSLCLCLSHLCECPCAVIYACTYACLFACLLMSSQVENGGTLDVNGIYVHIGGIQWESVYQRPKGQCTIHKFTEGKLGCTSDHVIQYTKVILSFM